MPKRICLVVCAVIFTGLLAVDSDAQRSRKSVSAAEVNGTFLMNFAGKFKGSSNEVKILALGKGKIKIAFDLVYPYIDGTGHPRGAGGRAGGGERGDERALMLGPAR